MNRHPVAVVGAGMAGLSCARHLHDHGVRVVVFERARGVGGRMSTRRADGVSFDHGAPGFFAEHPAFVKVVEQWRRDRVVDTWSPRIALALDPFAPVRDPDLPWYVGVPTMTAPAKAMAAGLDLRLSTNIVARDGHTLLDEDGVRHGPFSRVLVATPAPQAAHLLPSSLLPPVEIAGVWAWLGVLRDPIPANWDVATPSDGPVSWLGRERSKPGRPPAEAIMAHCRRVWSEARMDADPDAVLKEITAHISSHLGPVIHAEVHRWRYALPAGSSGELCRYDAGAGLGAAGDGYPGASVEGAWLSGRMLADEVLAS